MQIAIDQGKVEHTDGGGIGPAAEEGGRGSAPSQCGHRHDDSACRQRAQRLFDEFVGEPQAVLQWDERHHLQAHAHVGDRDFVLIAPRDDEHEPVLLDKDDWDHVSHTVGPERTQLLRHYAIRRHV